MPPLDASHHRPRQGPLRLLIRSLGGTLVEVIGRESDDLADVVVFDGVDEVARLRASVLKPGTPGFMESVLESNQDVMLLHYPGESRHPAGEYAPVSWFNDAGIGLLRVVRRNTQVLMLPLHGLQRSQHMPIQARGTRGPSRSADLWLCLAAWCLPLGCTITELVTTSGLAPMTVRKWVEMMTTNGLMAYDPLLSATARERRFVLVADQRKELEQFVVSNWKEWTSGTGHPDLRPQYLSFVSPVTWRQLRTKLSAMQLGVFPSGITVLEGGADLAPKAWLNASSDLPELFLYCPARSLEALKKLLDVTLHDGSPTGPVSSRICVLADDHPALRLVERRRISGIYAYHWPWGVAALDAWDHPDARVQQAAKQAWQEWVDNQEIEEAKHRVRND